MISYTNDILHIHSILQNYIQLNISNSKSETCTPSTTETIYDRLRSASVFKSASTPQIGIYWCHCLNSRSDLRVFSNRHPFQHLRSMAYLLFRVRIRAYISDVNLRKWEMAIDLKIGTPIWEFEIGHRFENFKKGKRCEDFNRFQPTDVLLCIFTLDKKGFIANIHSFINIFNYITAFANMSFLQQFIIFINIWCN